MVNYHNISVFGRSIAMSVCLSLSKDKGYSKSRGKREKTGHLNSNNTVLNVQNVVAGWQVGEDSVLM